MKFRIVLWAIAGFSIAAFWALLLLATAPVQATPILWAAVRVTCPIAIAGTRAHIHLFWVLVANAATYALAGVIVEELRRSWGHV